MQGIFEKLSSADGLLSGKNAIARRVLYKGQQHYSGRIKPDSKLRNVFGNVCLEMYHVRNNVTFTQIARGNFQLVY